MALNARQKLFVAEYLKDLCASAAYRRAGYKVTSDESACANAARLIGNDKVAAAIAAAQAKRSARTEITQDYVLERLKIEAEMDGEGSSPSARVRALDLLGKHLGMFPTKLEHSGPNGGPIQTQTVRILRPADAKPLDASNFLPPRQSLNGIGTTNGNGHVGNN